MAHRKAAVKRLRVDARRHARNLKIKTNIKKTLKKFGALCAAKNQAEAKNLLASIYSLLDKAAKKGIIHPNTASRRKARLSRRVPKSA